MNPIVTVQVEIRPGQGPALTARLIQLAAEYMVLVERTPTEGERWAIADRVFVFREDFGGDNV